MREDTKSTWQLKKETREEEWLMENSRYEAGLEFRRARWKARVRLLRGVFQGLRRPADTGSNSKELLTKEGLFIPLGSIVGMIDARGKEVPRLPPLRRELAATWRHKFCIDNVETYPILEVRSGPGGWYLMGGVFALLFLEIMRAKSWRLIRVTRVPEQAMLFSHNEAMLCAECPCEPEQPQIAS